MLKKTAFFLLLTCLLTAATSSRPGREFYELRIYHLTSIAQQTQLESYLKGALLPALHRAGIPKVGVFKTYGSDTASAWRLYVLIPLRSLTELVRLPQSIDKDKLHAQAGHDYLMASPNNPPYQRLETIVLQAFVGMPELQLPALRNPPAERVYELRSYEGPTEERYRNKVQMFNQGQEMTIFTRLGFNPIFYGEVLAGSRMPNLMYMTSFEDKASREAHWKAFGEDATWKALKDKPEYQQNVSKGDIFFLYPTSYSDI